MFYRFEADLKRSRFGFFVLVLLLSCCVPGQAQVLAEVQQSVSPNGTAKLNESQATLKNKARKPPIDSKVFDKWPSVNGPAISNDGNYACFVSGNQPVGNHTLVLRGIHTNWKIEIPSVGSYGFTQDSRMLVFTTPANTLGIAALGTDSITYIPHVDSFRLSGKRNGEWLAYQLNNPAKELVIRNLATGREISFPSVKDYVFSGNGDSILLQTETNTNSHALKYISLADGKATTIWQGVNAGNFVFDRGDTQLAFTAEEKVDDRIARSLWYYKAGTDKAVVLADYRSAGIDNGLMIARIQRFSNDGTRLFFGLEARDVPKTNSAAAKVDVWSYDDVRLQSRQLALLNPDEARSYTAVAKIQGRQIIQLEHEDEFLRPTISTDGVSDRFAIMVESKADSSEQLAEWDWNKAALASVFLISTVDGAKRVLKNPLPLSLALSYRLSPSGRYVVYYDHRAGAWMSYNVASGTFRNIVPGVRAKWTSSDVEDVPISSYSPRRVVGWGVDDSVLLYDQFDIWQADLSGKRPPINLTNGYGQRHKVVLRLADYQERIIPAETRLILNGFSRADKDDGFYSITPGKQGDPELLTKGPYVFDGPDESREMGAPFKPIRAARAEVYIVRRMKADESPNFFTTTDFKSFTPLSDVYPERRYNWLTTELVTWRTLDGGRSQGILYKPENFDPSKKYPVILHYYEKKSEGLHAYIRPEASIGSINIPFFVSNGYVVFVPDIHFKIGSYGKSAFNSIVSAARHLSTMPWADPKRMGIQGHSRGGYETNYVITHTNMFAAAMSSSGFSDFISLYGGIREDGSGRQGSFEFGFLRIGTTPWQRPDLYIENSPIFRADKVTTPLLMMNNKDDGDIPFSQGIELFTALRRLGRKTWLLQYDGQKHMAFDKAAEDLTIRMKQFFDHYLKGAPPPKWMTEGVPARMKGIDSGLELDTSGKKP